MAGLIAVHVGAGYHAESRRPLYKKLCKEACKQAIMLLNQNGNAVEAISQAVSCLEDSPMTNAGVGSNLTIDGKVECDSIVMDGNTLNFGSVGALYNIQNPVKVAQKILEDQNKGLMSCGRIPPCTLAGKGAFEWAKEHGCLPANSERLITKAAGKMYFKNMSLLQSANDSTTATKLQQELHKQRSCDESTLLDTVGAVCIDNLGNLSAALSSGGLLLKHSGRIGQAALYGSGCWAENSSVPNKPSIAVSATGAGEYLIKTLFAKECFQALYNDVDSINTLPHVFKTKFMDAPYLNSIKSKPAGVLTLKYYCEDKYCDLSWAHSTETMILGCMSTLDKHPYAWVSEQPQGSVPGKSVLASERHIKLS